MAEKKYCIKTETLAGFAKALGHPARIAIMKFLAKQTLATLATFMRSCLLLRHSPRLHDVGSRTLAPRSDHAQEGDEHAPLFNHHQ